MAQSKHSVSILIKARDQASKKFGVIRKSVARLGRAFKKISIVGVAAGAGLAYMVKQQMESIDATAKLSDRLGVATEQLVGLAHAAKITGTNSAALEKGLQRLAKGLGDVAMGSKESQYALDKLGLDLDELIKVDAAEQFKIIADSMSKLTSQTDKLAVAQKLFGKGGASLLNLLMLERVGIEKLQAEAEKLGLTFSRLDAAQVEAANDAMARLSALMTGAVRTLTIELAPAIEVITNDFIAMGTAGEGMGANVLAALEAMTRGVVYFSDQVEKRVQIIKGFEAAIEEVYVRGQRLVPEKLKGLSPYSTGKPASETPWVDYLKQLAEFETGGEKITKFFNRVHKQSEKLRLELAKAGSAAGASLDGNTEGFIKLQTSIEKVNEKLAAQVELYHLTARDKQLVSLKKMGEGLEGKELEGFNRMIAEISKSMEKLSELDAFSKLEKSAERLVKSLQSPIEKFKDLRSTYEKLFSANLINTKQFNQAIRAAGEELLKINKKAVTAFSPSSLQFTESRFLTFQPGSMVGGQNKVEKNSELTVKELRTLIKVSNKTLRVLEDNSRRSRGQLPQVAVTNFN